MLKTFTAQYKATTSRYVEKLSDEWTDFITLAQPIQTVVTNQADMNAMVYDVTNNIILPLCTALMAVGYTVKITDDDVFNFYGFADGMPSTIDECNIDQLKAVMLSVMVMRFSANLHIDFDANTHRYITRTDWFNNQDGCKNPREYQMIGKYQKVRKKKGGYSNVALEENGIIFETYANGNKKERKISYIDIFHVLKPQIKSILNDLVKDNFGGHIRVRMFVSGSVEVTG